ncbi:hypothetical protein [Streptomyces sp. NBC_00986]|uniref:hypothetical protein n=1 Tax=Streptomyces sp. NBC_00986 TaxID=2903702 RepID=UPI00386F96F9|nr:hypothetical protein OG504_45300 [Streptomyces sp. NBC_00986]
MSGQTEHTPIEAVEALESGAFRVGQVMRRLLAEHPDLPIRSIRPSVYVSGYFDEKASVAARVDVSSGSVDGVRAWAEALGGEPVIRIIGPDQPFEHAELVVDVDGVSVEVAGTRRLSDDETEAWRAEQDRAAAEESGAVPVGDAG